jgi:hypothetical protein
MTEGDTGRRVVPIQVSLAPGLDGGISEPWSSAVGWRCDRSDPRCSKALSRIGGHVRYRTLSDVIRTAPTSAPWKGIVTRSRTGATPASPAEPRFSKSGGKSPGLIRTIGRTETSGFSPGFSVALGAPTSARSFRLVRDAAAPSSAGGGIAPSSEPCACGRKTHAAAGGGGDHQRHAYPHRALRRALIQAEGRSSEKDRYLKAV